MANCRQNHVLFALTRKRNATPNVHKTWCSILEDHSEKWISELFVFKNVKYKQINTKLYLFFQIQRIIVVLTIFLLFWKQSKLHLIPKQR